MLCGISEATVSRVASKANVSCVVSGDRWLQYMESMDVVFLLVLLCLMGTLVGGPNNIITSAVTADIADQFGSKACGTITGIINGSGSITAAAGQLLIPIFSSWGEHDGVGYRYVWLFLVFCTIVGTLCLWPKIKKELANAKGAVMNHDRWTDRRTDVPAKP